MKMVVEVFKADQLEYVALQRAYIDFLHFLSVTLESPAPHALDEFIEVSNKEGWYYYKDGEFY